MTGLRYAHVGALVKASLPLAAGQRPSAYATMRSTIPYHLSGTRTGNAVSSTAVFQEEQLVGEPRGAEETQLIGCFRGLAPQL